MNYNPHLRCALILAILLVLLIPGPVQADIAPPSPPNGINIEPGKDTTNVRMVSEKVLIEVSSQSAKESGSATVTATFQMRNLGDKEERMDVRFPLYAVEVSIPDDPNAGGPYHYPPLENFTAWVNSSRAEIHNTSTTLDKSGTDGGEVTFPAWANFPVVFPVGKDVNIKVQYIQTGWDGYDKGSGYSAFSYILFTGAAWKDTIGSADITVHLPMEANDTTLIEVKPEGATIAGNEIHWHLEDFEPDTQNNTGVITAGVLLPKYYFKIQDMLKAVAEHPNDGEAWGQLGKAYKAAIRMTHGFRQETAGERMYWQMVDAYQKAVELLPKDADWHYGYADALCSNAEWNHHNRTPEDPQAPYRQCFEQLNQALAINPKHAGANELLQNLAEMQWVDLSGAQPVYLILTPTETIVPTQTIIPTQTLSPSPFSTYAVYSTRTSTATIAPTAEATITPGIQPTATPLPNKPASTSPVCGAALLPVLLVAVWGWRRFKIL